MISDTVLDRIQDTASLVTLVESKGIQLKQIGKDHFGLCPFHDEKTPSWSVNDRYHHCLGCGAHGNIFQFLMELDKVSFVEAVKAICVEFKIPIDTVDLGEAQIQHETQDRYDQILTSAVKYWERTYKATKEAKRYIKARGIEPSLAIQYHVGYDDGDLIGHLVADCGFDKRDLRSIGIMNDKSNSRMHGRLIFPVYKDLRVVNVCGRSLERNPKIKYLNLKPGEGVFNFNKGRKEKTLWVVEGIIDALVMISVGVQNVVASLGTQGLKDTYIGALKRSNVQTLNLLPDHDLLKANEKHPESYKTAAMTAARVLNLGLNVRIGEIPTPGEDPAKYLSNGGSIDKVKLKEPLKWLKENTSGDFPNPILVARRLSDPGAGPDKHKEFEVSIAGQKWQMLSTNQSTSGLKGCLMVLDKTGKEIFKDRVDLWSTVRRRTIAKEVNLTESVVNTICSIIEKQFDVLSQLDREARKAFKLTKDGNSLPEYAQELAEELRTSPTLLDDIRDDITDMGYVGEDTNKVLLYLIGISAMLAEPLGCFIASDSGSGKSALIETVVKLFPAGSFHLLSRMTDQSLFYVSENQFKHTWLIIAERQGIEQSEAADFNLRTFFSEKRLTLLNPIKNDQSGRYQSEVLTVYGPISYTETTTSIDIHDENATRLIEMNIKETEEQTAIVHDFQRSAAAMNTAQVMSLTKNQKRLAMKHKAFIKSLKPVEVRIPYAEQITFPTHLTRSRRDLPKFLNLIKVIAFIHQYQRNIEEVDGTYFIEATAEDYEMAHTLSKDSIRKAFAVIQERSQDLLKEIFRLLSDRKTGLIDVDDEELSTFTIRDLTDAGVNKTPPTIRKYLIPLIENDIIAAAEPGSRGRGNVSRFRVRIPALDDAVDIAEKEITSPKKMRELIDATRGKRKAVSNDEGFDPFG